MSSRAAAIAALERRLGMSFQDRALLDRALTHASKLGQGRSGVLHNERLEFLGDRVLGLIIAEELSRRNLEAGPEILAKHYAHLVSRKVCAQIAVQAGLAEAMDVPKAQGLRSNDTVLADACEALLAAVYLDHGFDGAKAVVLDLWREALDQPLDLEAAKTWIAKGAGATDRVHKWLANAGLVKARIHNNPQKAQPKKKAQERAAAAAKAAEAA